MIATAENLKDACGIYGVIHRDSGRVYVGQSKDISFRLYRHRSHARHSRLGGKLYNAVRKYGEEAFDFEVLEHCEPEKLNERERFYIQFMDSVNNGFNIAAFPEKTRLGVVHSEETKRKMSASHKARLQDPSARALQPRPFLGKKLSPEHAANISSGRKKPVIQLSLSGEVVAEHASLEDAAFAVSRSCSSLSQSISGKRGQVTCAGFIWKFKPKHA